jgi:cardiolipin synthase
MIRRYLFVFGVICVTIALAGVALPYITPTPLGHQALHLSLEAPLSLITEPDDGTQAILENIKDASTSIDLVIYELEDPAVEQALVDAHIRGVTVRVLLDNLNTFGRHPNQPAFDFLKNNNVQVEWSPRYFALTHQKTFIFDDTRAIVMTFNLTPQYYDSSRDFGLVDDDTADVVAIENAFDSDWNSKDVTADVGDDLVWSPGSADTLLELIRSASTTLDIYNEEMADPRVMQALEDASTRGVLVRVDMTYATNWKPAFNELTNAGVEVRTYASSAKFYIHAKVIIADQKETFVGSENFSGQSLDANRELGLLIEKPDILNSLEQTFNSDWASSRPYVVKN